MIAGFLEKRSFLSIFFGIIMLPLSLLYLFFFFLKKGLTKSIHFPGSICIGNLTAGGTGKTPLTLFLAKHLSDPLILSGGYGGSFSGIISPEEKADINTSDETRIYRRNIPKAPLVIGKSRTLTLSRFLDKSEDKYTIIADDALQHFPLKADCNVLVVKADNPYGNGFVIPGGVLREPVASGLKRCDIIAVNTTFGTLPAKVEKRLSHTGLPLFNFKYDSEGIFDIKGVKTTDPLDEYFIFSSIAHPHAFQKTIAAMGIRITGKLHFKDHHRYTEKDLKTIQDYAKGNALLTTEKDMVKLFDSGVEDLYYLKVRCKFEDEQAFLAEVRKYI